LKTTYLFIVFLFFQSFLFAQNLEEDFTGIRAIGSVANPKVEMSWRKYHDYKQIQDFQYQLEKKFPNLIKVNSIGKSYQGRDIWALTITDFKAGKPLEKPAFYMDGGIHANELNSVQVCLYTAWYLCENYAYIPFIQQLLKEKTIYILPNISPDSREHFLYQPNSANSSRSGQRPFDNDGDGSIDEDQFNDLDKDGNITMMRRKSIIGKWKQDPKYPSRMFQVKGDELGDYEMLGYEGIDTDGDGQVNEDTEGGYDPNRDWAWNWQPNYAQSGSIYYPGTLPETRAVKNFVLQHKNINGATSYHNYGGMFLRGPGTKEEVDLFSESDIKVFDHLGKVGEKMVPGYRYLIGYKDLYPVMGGERDFFELNRGIYFFTVELMTSYKLFNQKPNNINRLENDEFNEFDKYLLFGDAYVSWKSFNHPQFGEIEIGGAKKNYIRNHPGFMLEEDLHRNMAFALYNAYQTPKLEIVEVISEQIDNEIYSITATIFNSRIMPTHSDFDSKNKINAPNYVSISHPKVISGLIVESKDLNLIKEQKNSLQTIEIPNIGGMDKVIVQWIVSGKPNDSEIIINSIKAGIVKHQINLQNE
jgi:Zinc carboxypeptidase